MQPARLAGDYAERVADPEVSTVVIDVTFESLDGDDYQLFTLYDPWRPQQRRP